MSALYDSIGAGYADVRRPDPRFAARVDAALGTARTVVNVGAGTGNYEPAGRHVVALDPSAVMLAQRPPDAGPGVRGVAEALPFRSGAFDAAMATFTLHHWPDLAAGLAEMRRVADRQVVLFCEPSLSHGFWLMDYFPQIAALPAKIPSPRLTDIAPHLQVRSVQTLLVPADCTDGFAGAFWNRPEAFLAPAVQAGMSILARLPGEALERGTARLRDDLRSGAWDARLGHLRGQSEFDTGYRLVVAVNGR